MAWLKWGDRKSFTSMNSSGKPWPQSKDPREVVTDPKAHYYGIEVSEKALVPENGARLGETRFETWLTQPQRKRRRDPLVDLSKRGRFA